MQALNDAFIVEEVGRYSTSCAGACTPEVYMLGNGLCNMNGGFDRRLLENAIFNILYRQEGKGIEFSYYSDQSCGVDFVVSRQGH